MTKYCIIDVANLLYRARHVVRGDAYTKAGMALAIVFKSLRKVYREMKADHMVFCVEDRSWRYDVFPQYKAKRRLDRMIATAADKEEEEAFTAVLNDFVEFMAEKTRCTVLQSPGVEGDDFIARWVQLHPKDDHVIISGDSDFVQLLAPNISIYNGVDDRLLTVNGLFSGDGEPLYFYVDGKNGKIKVPGTIADMKKKHEDEQKKKQREHNQREKERQKLFTEAEKQKKLDDPDYVPRMFVAHQFDWEEFTFEPETEWWRKALFVKLVRGDTGDGIFSSYPGVRYEGSKNKVGIQEAWEDRDSMGFHWNNFMLQTWEKLLDTDANGNAVVQEVRVLDEYKFNESLIDLTRQPENVKALMDEVIIQAVQKDLVNNVGIHFLRFCDRNDLPSLTRDATEHAAYLNAPYAKN
jgi:hypothetical protein